MKNKVITRIAPSPTGKFHIGNARTALFNYLFAKNPPAGGGGQFLLRIEDTDRARSSEAHIADIKESLEWLGLEWDNKNTEHYQSKRIDEYKKIVDKLVVKGYAYEKDGAIYFKIQETKNPPERLKSFSRAGKKQENIQPLNFKTNNIVFDDLIHGRISVSLKDIEDFVILKSDGWPTFHLAVVVDDHDTGVTHIIRGDDHLSNTPKHILLYRALGWELPQWGHLPLILNTDRSKMSKRKDPVSVTGDFKAKGFLPEAMVNYLAFLGWNPKTDEEFFALDELVKKFKIEDVQQSNAVFDMGKLRYYNAYYLRQKSLADLVKLAKLYWQEQFDLSKFNEEYLESIVNLTRERASTCEALAQGTEFYFMPPKIDNEKIIFRKSTKINTIKGLKALIAALDNIKANNWNEEHLLAALTRVVEREKLSNGDVFWPARYALSGEDASPKPEEILSVLGKKESLERLKVAENLLKQSQSSK